MTTASYAFAVPTFESQKTFLAGLAQGWSVSSAAEAADIPRHVVSEWRALDAAFSVAWDDAIEVGSDRLEDEAVRRAMAGSDTLLMFLLEARRPTKFRNTTAGQVKQDDDEAAVTKPATGSSATVKH